MENNLSVDVIQSIEFEILKYVKQICDLNGLRYYLAYGTLIGAVRHQGFIPWDDDVDIHMPRDDYYRLVSYVKQNPHPYYRLISPETNSTFTHILAKVIDTRTKLTQKTHWSERVQLGVYVDIFLLDGAGHSLPEAEATYLAAYSYYKQWEKSATIMFPPGANKRHAFNRWCHYLPAKMLGVHYHIDKHTSFCVQKPYDQYEYVAAMAAATPEPSRNIWKREWFGDGTAVLLNDTVFRAPQNWDAILRPEYGDYMQLPPEEKRHSHHSFELEIPDELLPSPIVK